MLSDPMDVVYFDIITCWVAEIHTEPYGGVLVPVQHVPS